MHIVNKLLCMFACIAISAQHHNTINFQWIKSERGALKTDFLKTLKQWFKSNTFIETGTFGGETIANAVADFDIIHSVELSTEFYNRAVIRYAQSKNIQLHHGDSPTVLRSILPLVCYNPIIWLDAHYCGVGTARSSSDSPILQELDALKSKPESIILIDDLRGFYYDNWCALGQVIHAIKNINHSYHLIMIADSILAYPDNYELTISPFLNACTISRLFDIENTSYSLEQVFEAEKNIVNITEKELTDFVKYSRFTDDTYDHYGKLWNGLIKEHAEKYEEAIALFKQILEIQTPRTLSHWRVTYYLARCYHKAGMSDSAKKTIKSILPISENCTQVQELCKLMFK